jgi:hypothetical protein
MQNSAAMTQKINQAERKVDNLAHLERLATAMAPDPTRWEYRGEVLDGGGGLEQVHCTCGHPIRWIFPIYDRDSGRSLPIGSTCIAASVPYLIHSGAQGLADALQAALQRHQEALAEAARQVRDAVNNEVVASLLATREALFTWAKGEREVGTYLPRGLWTDAVYRNRQAAACSTPGRTAASLRKRLENYYVDSFRVVRQPQGKMPLPKDAVLRGKILAGVEDARNRARDAKRERLDKILAALHQIWE